MGKLTDILAAGGQSGDGFANAWNATEAAGDFEPLPAGKYVCRVESGELDTSSTKRTPGYSKGFHVGAPLSLFGSPESSHDFHRVCRQLAETLAGTLGVAIDSGVYDKVRAFRAPNSRHPKTGRHKMPFTFGELLALTMDGIVRLAESPQPFAVPGITGPKPPAAHHRAVADWQAAAEAVASQRKATAERRTNNADATLNRATLEFIRDGATTGDRHRLLYSAAANLAEFGCPSPLANALLSEAALDSGLPPSEVRRQILCGLGRGDYPRWPEGDAYYEG